MYTTDIIERRDNFDMFQQTSQLWFYFEVTILMYQ